MRVGLWFQFLYKWAVASESTAAADSNVYFARKEMFISAESAFVRIQLQLASPQLTHGGGSTPTETALCPTGMRVLASNCGNKYVDLTLLGLKWALTLKWNA